MKPTKIFPRNLTARAAYLVPGNPASSRTESALDTSSPGYDMDVRTLDQRFFPGLVFEFERTDGAVLSGLELTDRQKTSGITDADCFGGTPLFLWAIYGRTDIRGHLKILGFARSEGPQVWRRVRDLAPGRVAILLGPGPPAAQFFFDAQQALQNAHKAEHDDSQSFRVSRDSQGVLQYAVFAGDRARFLDRHGVIDPDAYRPGELTKATCAPWINDFRVCTCFYWSTSKPDMISGEKERYLDFFRDRAIYPNSQDLRSYDDRKKRHLQTNQLAMGAWEGLPVILNDREEQHTESWPPVTDLYNRSELIAELRYLATVEHALVVEYLFAHYSVDAPARPPAPPPNGKPEDDPVSQRFAFSRDVFRIGIDEMRHFLWANELLHLLGAKTPSLARAMVLSASPNGHDGRKTLPGMHYLNLPFHMGPLTLVQIERFLKLEQISQQLNVGMYIHALMSVVRQPEMFPEHTLLVPTLKLLIDEGEDHYTRLLAVQSTVQCHQGDYLRHFQPPSTAEQKFVLELAGDLYGLVLDSVAIDFWLGDLAGGEILRVARKFMNSLDCMVRLLADDRIAFEFPIFEPQYEEEISCDSMEEIVNVRRSQLAKHLKGADRLSLDYRKRILECLSHVEEYFGEILRIIGASR